MHPKILRAVADQPRPPTETAPLGSLHDRSCSPRKATAPSFQAWRELIKLYSHDGRDREKMSRVTCDIIRIPPHPAFTRQERIRPFHFPVQRSGGLIGFRQRPGELALLERRTHKDKKVFRDFSAKEERMPRDIVEKADTHYKREL